VADAAALRQAFAEFLGEARFREFVRQLAGPELYLGRPGEHWPPGRPQPGCSKGLRSWQQREWDRFTAAHPEFAVGAEELTRALRVCEMHGQELQPEVADVFHGCVDYIDEYVRALPRFFPNAWSGPVSTECAPCEDRRVVWYCPACRKAEAEWMTRWESR